MDQGSGPRPPRDLKFPRVVKHLPRGPYKALGINGVTLPGMLSKFCAKCHPPQRLSPPLSSHLVTAVPTVKGLLLGQARGSFRSWLSNAVLRSN